MLLTRAMTRAGTTPIRLPASRSSGHRRGPRTFAVVLAAVLAASGIGIPTAAHARHFGFFPQVPLLDFGPIEDQLEILVRDREILAVDAWTHAITSVDLFRGESVLWTGVRGRVALAITDRRALATVPGLSSWAERAFELRESSPERILLGDRVALLVTDRRVFGFEGVSGSWSEAGLGPREEVLLADAGTNVAVAVTRTRVLGVAAARGGLFQADLGIREEVQSLHAHGSLATVTTRLRLLTFRAPDGIWQSTDLSFR